ncbi:MAG: helicase-related protein, partial [Pseudomonadota bacterium]|nr:helicase-related protein [Pseudomonadota bacterium]
VYAIAEVVRQQKGGAAVVMGALSPRTRNAQVDMYQSGEVDFIVATDAIGMGLNMDVDHVGFAQTRKFDGRNHRELVAAELAQVAGRAGRHTSDGTFGVTGEMPALEESLVEQIENNIFEPIRRLMWRNTNLDFSSVEALKISLEASPPTRGLIRVPITIDMQALNMMTTDPCIKDRAVDENSIRLLWEVAQIPDFRKTIIGEHASILGDIFLFLSGDQVILPAKWIEERIARCDRTDGDLDTLGSRLAHIRTWTYVTQKNGWVENQHYWQAQARQVEDKLSDALHQGLMKQFVDTRSSILLKRLQGRDEAEAEIDSMGDVHVEGEYAGRIEGLQFTKDNRMTNSPPRSVRAAIEKVVGQELRNRASELAACPDDELKLNEQGEIFWRQSCIAKLVAGRNLLTPEIKLLADESLVGPPRNQIEARLAAFVRRHLDRLLAPLITMKNDESLNGLARGLAFQIVEHGGHIPRANIAETLSEIDQPARAGLRKLGLRF